MQATQRYSTLKSNGNAVTKNSALPDPQKLNSQINSNNGKLKSTANLKEEHQRSESQEGSYFESGHEKRQTKAHQKNLADTKRILEKEKLSEERQFEKIQSHDSSETTISYSHSSNTKSSSNTKKNDLLQDKAALDKKFKDLKEKQAATKNKASREYENRGRELERLEEKIKSINEELGADNSYLITSPASENFDSNKSKKNEAIFSRVEFNEIVKAIQLIEDEIKNIEENNDGLENTESNTEELKKDRDHLIGLMEKFTEIFEVEKYDSDSKKLDSSIDNNPRIKRTRPVPRTIDSERKVARSKLIDKSSDQSDYYQALCLRFNLSLKEIKVIKDQLEIVNSETKDKKLKIALRNEYKILGDVAQELHAFSAPASDSNYITLLLETIKSPDTRKLENEYDAAFNEYKKELDTWSCTWLKSAAGKLFAGPAAFSVSFLIGNTITRLVPPDHQRWINYSIAPFWSGAAHALFTGPIASQLLPRVWTSPILGEMKNYFLLLASYGADRWKGELDKKKYSSKDTEKTEKLTIVERWDEERPISKINWERMKTEETGYYAYTMNYILKGIGPALAPTAFASKDLLTRGYDAIAHGVAGAISSAEYVYSQQYLRSLDPKAKEVILPTREISSMEAAKLKSLAVDLDNAIDSDQYKNDTVAQQAFARLSRTTNRAAIIAERKSHYFGTLTHELRNSFKDVPSSLDMTAEALGRIVSLMFVAGMSQVTSELRKSTDPGLRFLGHVIPAIDLMVPPGWAFRGLYIGYIRAALELVYQINKSDEKKPDVKKQDTVTRMPNIAPTPMDGTTQSASESNTANNDVDNDAEEDSSIIISMAYDSSEGDSSDSNGYDGNPKPSDELGW